VQALKNKSFSISKTSWDNWSLCLYVSRMDMQKRPSGLAKALGVTKGNLGQTDVSRPVYVRIATAGKECIVNINLTTTVQAFRKIISQIAISDNIPPKDQILLVGRLQSRGVLAAGKGLATREVPNETGLKNSKKTNSLEDNDTLEIALPFHFIKKWANLRPFVQMNSSGGRTVLSYNYLSNAFIDYNTKDENHKSNVGKNGSSVIGDSRDRVVGVVYVFDRRILSSRAQCPSMAMLKPQHVAIPSDILQISDSATNFIMSSSAISGDPLLAAVAAAERQFLLHLRQGLAWKSGGEARLSSCKQSIRCQSMQINSLGAAIENLCDFFDAIKKQFVDFTERSAIQRKNDKSILLCFPEDLNFLKRMALHEKLACNGKSTLYDCCPVERLSRWASDCNHMDDGLDEQIEQLKTIFKKVEVSFNLDSVESSQAIMAVKLNDLNNRVIEIESNQIRGVLSKGVSDLKKDHECLEDILQNSTNKNDELIGIVKMIGKTRIKHLNTILPQCASIVDDALLSLMETCSELQYEISLFQFHELRKVSKFQAALSDLKRKQNVLANALNAQTNRINQLLPMKMMPSAYAACLAEVARRRAFREKIFSEVKYIAKRMSQLRAEEIERRETFLRRHGCYLPADLVPGLSNPRPAAVEIGICSINADESLPEVDIDASAAALYDNLGLSDILLSTIAEYKDMANSNEVISPMLKITRSANMDASIKSLKLANITLRQELISRFSVDVKSSKLNNFGII
jgi:hypothetical protein